VTAAHTAADAGDTALGRRLAHSAAVLAAALGVEFDGAASEVDDETARLVAERDGARAARDFARADALRDELVALGWTVEDTPGGTAVRR
jgi:cysteinyl-tRNA synthetase